MDKLLLWIGGILIGAGVSVTVYSMYYDTGTQCLERYDTADEVATCVDILNGG
jgi:hypothetical protein